MAYLGGGERPGRHLQRGRHFERGGGKKSKLAVLGPSIKYVTLEGEGVREGVTVCDRGRGQEHVTSRLYTFLSYI